LWISTKPGQSHSIKILTKMDVHQERTEAGMSAWRKATEACLEIGKAGLEEMEAAVDVFEERMSKKTQRIWRPIRKSGTP
jgi:hypothetical protein